MSKLGQDLIQSIREAREHAEGIQNASDHGALLHRRRRTKVTSRGTLLRQQSLKRRVQCGVVGPHPGEGRFRVHVVAVPNVRAIRLKLGISQTEFAERYKIPLATLKNWEQRRR